MQISHDTLWGRVQDMDGLEAERFNQKFWDELAHVHYRAYDLQGLRDGGSV